MLKGRYPTAYEALKPIIKEDAALEVGGKYIYRNY